MCRPSHALFPILSQGIDRITHTQYLFFLSFSGFSLRRGVHSERKAEAKGRQGVCVTPPFCLLFCVAYAFSVARIDDIARVRRHAARKRAPESRMPAEKNAKSREITRDIAAARKRRATAMRAQFYGNAKYGEVLRMKRAVDHGEGLLRDMIKRYGEGGRKRKLCACEVRAERSAPRLEMIYARV